MNVNHHEMMRLNSLDEDDAKNDECAEDIDDSCCLPQGPEEHEAIEGDHRCQGRRDHEGVFLSVV